MPWSALQKPVDTPTILTGPLGPGKTPMVQAAKKAYGQSASLDCHLTQTLVKRFMKGDELSDALLADVERHLSVCKECMAVASGDAKPMGERAELSPALAQAVSVIQQPKNLFLLGALAVVLILMGTVLRNPTNLLGPKAGANLKPEAQTESKAETTAKAEPHADETKPVDEIENKPKAQPTASHTSEPQAATMALQGLQEADPEPQQPTTTEPTSAQTSQAPEPAQPTNGSSQTTANEGTPEPAAKKSDVIVVHEESAAKAKPIKRAKAVKKVTKPERTVAPSAKAKKPRAATAQPEVKVFDETGKAVH